MKQRKTNLKFLKIIIRKTIKNVNEIVKALTKDSITTFPALNWIIGIPVANGKCFSTDKAKSFKFFGIDKSFAGKSSTLS